ncbi:MAG: hypothetical protein ACLT98_11305 [Eggerthellaceae bacterium]
MDEEQCWAILISTKAPWIGAETRKRHCPYTLADAAAFAHGATSTTIRLYLQARRRNLFPGFRTPRCFLNYWRSRPCCAPRSILFIFIVDAGIMFWRISYQRRRVERTSNPW